MCAKFQTHYGMTYNIHTLHNLLHICMSKYGRALTCMSLEGVWLQLVIQAKKILIKWNVGAVDKQRESENAWRNGHSTYCWNCQPKQTSSLPPPGVSNRNDNYSIGNDSIEWYTQSLLCMYGYSMKHRGCIRRSLFFTSLLTLHDWLKWQ